MDKQQMLTKIYEVIADKILSFGCKVIMRDTDIKYGTNICCPDWLAYYHNDGRWWFEFDKSKLVEIIWHPVMLGDVLDWIEKNKMEWANRDHLEEEKYEFWDMLNYLCAMRWTKNQPIDNQSEDCIKYVYDLLPPSSSNDQ